MSTSYFERNGFRVYSTTFYGEDFAARVVGELVHHSQWFELTPLPDDYWEVIVKEENRSLLTKLLREAIC